MAAVEPCIESRGGFIGLPLNISVFGSAKSRRRYRRVSGKGTVAAESDGGVLGRGSRSE